MTNDTNINNRFYFKALNSNKLRRLSRDWLGISAVDQKQGCLKIFRPLDIDDAISWLQSGKWQSYPKIRSGLVHCTHKQTGLPFNITVADGGSRAYLEPKKNAILVAGDKKTTTKSLRITAQGDVEKSVSQTSNSSKDALNLMLATELLKKNDISSQFAARDRHGYRTPEGVITNKTYSDLAEGNLHNRIHASFKNLNKPELREKTLKGLIASLMPAMHELKKWHSKNIVHRDIKPENFFEKDGQFSLAAIDWATDRPAKDPCGTRLFYLPALKFQRDLPIHLMKRGDVFALGCSLLTILNCRYSDYQKGLNDTKSFDDWLTLFNKTKSEILSHKNNDSKFETELRQLVFETISPSSTLNISDVVQKLESLLKIT
tara:strand:- start:1579 stop:2703 length:1125 start_codon:yes stop_codon:yes gene_type:complete